MSKTVILFHSCDKGLFVCYNTGDDIPGPAMGGTGRVESNYFFFGSCTKGRQIFSPPQESKFYSERRRVLYRNAPPDFLKQIQ